MRVNIVMPSCYEGVPQNILRCLGEEEISEKFNQFAISKNTYLKSVSCYPDEKTN